MLLTSMLCTLLAHATPPPATEGVGRIEGLHRTFVTPSTFVDGLVPSVAADGLMPVAFLQLEDGEDAVALAQSLGGLAGVQSVEVEERRLRITLADTWRDLSDEALPDGRTVAQVGSLSAVPRVRLPLPGSSASPIRHPVGPTPVKLPGSSESPFGRPPTPSEPPPNEPGWDLEIFNRHLGGVTVVVVEGIEIGEALPFTRIVLHDVKPGLYAVSFRTPGGLERTTQVRPAKRQ